jgi:hypothetical protein
VETEEYSLKVAMCKITLRQWTDNKQTISRQ